MKEMSTKHSYLELLVFHILNDSFRTKIENNGISDMSVQLTILCLLQQVDMCTGVLKIQNTCNRFRNRESNCAFFMG